MIETSIFEEQEINKSSDEYKTLMELYAQYAPERAEVGSTFIATYVGYDKNDFLFEVSGLKDYIRVNRSQVEVYYVESMEIGEETELIITSTGNRQGFSIDGSIAKLFKMRANQYLKNIDNNTPVIGHIVSSNPAGYDVDILINTTKVAAFMPNTLAGINKLYDPESIVGESFEVMIESFSEKEGTYIVSRKRYLSSLIPDAVNELNYDDIYEGYVTGTTSFGVFVEFGTDNYPICLTGLIHKMNINPDYVDKIEQIQPGTGISFYVKEIIGKGKKRKIILTQILTENIWDTIEIGDELNAVVDEEKDFGLLVNLEGDTKGLIISDELRKYSRKFTSNELIRVKVIDLDRSKRRIFLTLA